MRTERGRAGYEGSWEIRQGLPDPACAAACSGTAGTGWTWEGPGGGSRCR
ncbi:hypothetical protein ACFV1B_11305 [Streptomyces sp. NPDC059637]